MLGVVVEHVIEWSVREPRSADFPRGLGDLGAGCSSAVAVAVLSGGGAVPQRFDQLRG